MLDPGPGGRDAPTASPAAPGPASGSSWCPLGAMEEQEVWPKHMEVTAGGGQGWRVWPVLLRWGDHSALTAQPRLCPGFMP